MATKTFSLLPFLFFLLIAVIFFVPCGGGSSAVKELRKACRVTRYRSLCVRSLSSFSHAAGPRGPRLWARAAVSVALAESKGASDYASGLLRGSSTAADAEGRRSTPRLRGAARGVLDDCAECLGDAVAELHSALSELRRLNPGAFAWQMSNVETWASAALTDQGTCLDELAGLREQQGAAAAAALQGLKGKVLNATYLCSNGLALVNSLASSGGRT